MAITKDAKLFALFEKSYWNYFLELEQQFIATKRFVEFEKANFKAFSMEYLKLLEAVCSEIDVVGKEIAHQINPSFKPADTNANIQKWWYIIQDWVCENTLSPVTMYDMEFDPWKGFRIERFTNKKGAICHRLEGKSETPYWWNSYNKVKHNRTLADPETQEKFFHRANLGNLFDAFAALYILEKRYMMSVGRAEEYNRVQTSRLFESRKPEFYLDEEGHWCQAID